MPHVPVEEPSTGDIPSNQKRQRRWLPLIWIKEATLGLTKIQNIFREE
jgi:hypothetical protein